MITSPAAHVDGNSFVSPASHINGNSRVEGGAKVFGTVTDSTIKGPAIIGEHALLYDSTIIGDVFINRAHVSDSYLTDGCEIDILNVGKWDIFLRSQILHSTLKDFKVQKFIHMDYVHVWSDIP